MSAPRILAIDPSLTSTGICLPDGTCMTCAPKKATGMERIEAIVVWLTGAIGTTDPDLVVVEECIVQHPNVESMWLHGVIRNRLYWSQRAPWVDIHPSRRQKWACGDQKDRGKDAVLLRAVRAGAQVENNDEADAWTMKTMAEIAYTLPCSDLMVQYQREVLAAIDWPEVNGHKPVWPMPKPIKRPRQTGAAT